MGRGVIVQIGCAVGGPLRFPLRSLSVGAGACLLLTAGCTAMRAVDRADLSPPNPPTRAWVTRADHTTVVFDSARVSADTLIGSVDGQPQRLPLSEATVLRVREAAPDRTAKLVVLPAFGAAVVLVLYFRRQAGLCVRGRGAYRTERGGDRVLLPLLKGRPRLLVARHHRT